MTQAQLAEAVHLSEQAISQIERGKSAASLPTLEALANTLDVPVRELFPIDGDPADARSRVIIERITARLTRLSASELERIEAVLLAMLR